MNERQQKAIEEYRRSDIMTAGNLKSFEKLLDKAVLLMHGFQDGDVDTQTRIQNILSQVQSSLNISYEPAQEIFVSIAPIWDAVDTGNKEFILKATGAVEYLRDTIRLLQKK